METSKQERMFALLESKDSDQSVSDFCKEQGIKDASFYYWQKKYREMIPKRKLRGLRLSKQQDRRAVRLQPCNFPEVR
jgi:transposase-like protein